MFKTLKLIFSLLIASERKKIYWVFLLIVMMAIFDVIGISSVFPFLSVLVNPEIIQTNYRLKWIYEKMQFTSRDNFFIFLGVCSFIMIVLSSGFRIWTQFVLLRFTWHKHYTISNRLLSRYLYEPYAFFLDRNSAELTSYLLTIVARVLSGVVIPALQIFAKTLLT